MASTAISLSPAVSTMAFSAVALGSAEVSVSARPVMIQSQAGARRGARAQLGSSFTSRRQSAFMNGGESGAVLAAAVLSAGIGRAEAGRGGALTVEMNLFQRIVRVAKSYANAVVSAAEDPEKLLEQTVNEMTEDLAKMRQASAQVLASQKQLENKYKQAQSTADDWYRRARLALEKGDETLAKEALKRRKDNEDNANGLKAQLDQQKGVVETLISNTKLLEQKIQEARAKKDTLKARAQSAKTSAKVSQMLGSIDTNSSFAAFDKMEEKVLQLEAEADATNQLTSDDLTSKFALLEGGSAVDDDLAALKKEMISPKGELPAGRSSIPSSPSTPTSSTDSSSTNAYKKIVDIELERELEELRKKAREL